jgi:hypothetical protein
MTFLGYAYRFASNFIFLALVYYSLNLIEKYPQRAILALLMLVYAGMHSASALRSIYFSSASSGWRGRRAQAGGNCSGRPERGGLAQADCRRRRGTPLRRRDEGLYRPAVSGAGHPALHRQDRDQLNGASC